MNKRFKSLKSVSDIVDTMIKGLKREWVMIDMTSFGHSKNGICFGCAATNTLCELMQESFYDSEIEYRVDKFGDGIASHELELFEGAIDELRRGDIEEFLFNLGKISHLFSFELPTLGQIGHKELPIITTDTWKVEIISYEAYRDYLISKNL